MGKLSSARRGNRTKVTQTLAVGRRAQACLAPVPTPFPPGHPAGMPSALYTSATQLLRRVLTKHFSCSELAQDAALQIDNLGSIHGVTQLGFYILDRDCLCGEHLVVTGVSSCTPGGFFSWCSEPWPEHTFMPSSRFLSPHSSFPWEVPLPHQGLPPPQRKKQKVREEL